MSVLYGLDTDHMTLLQRNHPEENKRRMPVPCPFPGMDPYLEHPTLWPGVHNGLIAALQLSLAPQLRPRYYVALEERVYVTEPDEKIGVRLIFSM